ncbi:MAG TPA: hypothetical protein VGO80_07875 [Solirubrobacteraceae bacterium]|nr:hypothetical protein [Solirubrobacteraceae bacterium]
MTSSSRRFRFVQLEYPWRLGPEPGRYPIRERLGEATGWILVLRTLGAAERRTQPRLRRRRAVRAPPSPPPELVTTTRATLVDAAHLDGRDTAERWLRAADLGALAAGAIVRLNRVLHAHRIATADPYAHEVSLHQALVVRVGFGAGEQVADGHWDQARELPRERPGAAALRPGRAALRPQERLAALLGGRDAALACEELALRARSDLDAGRVREAAIGLRTTLDAALAELEPWRDQAKLSLRLDELRDHRAAVGAAASAALCGGLDEQQIATVRVALGRVEAALRARTAGGL